MKLYRGPETGSNFDVTDEKNAKKVIGDWNSYGTIYFDGTINKKGSRHTMVGVEIEEEEIVALADALFKRMRETIDDLSTAMSKIYNLIEYHSDKAPSQDALIKAIKQVAENYKADYDGYEARKRKAPQIGWIDWDKI
jgi:hypothetical protein